MPSPFSGANPEKCLVNQLVAIGLHQRGDTEEKPVVNRSENPSDQEFRISL
jgi:hypothetical protein